MQPQVSKYLLGQILLLILCCFESTAQNGSSVELAKPDKYQNRKLASEKTGEKKFSTPKRIYTNTVTHYNYYFNANAKLEEIIAKAKEIHKDDYTQLLSFYNYSLDETAKDQIDTVIYKCTAAILLHDLRSDWVDRNYLLLGNAYMHRKNFDSAAMVFQFINYAFSPKDDGYDIPIGSNESNTNGVFSISSSEKRNIWKKISSNPPARNESFLYQVRNYIEQKKLAEAEALLEIIRIDKLFPQRLRSDWFEMEAYLQYNRQNYDSAAVNIIKALENADNKAEKARWEYLAAQLFERAGKDSASIKWYEKSIQHTTDPIMEVYARLKIVGLSSENKPNALQENLNQLLVLAKKDKYTGYRDIIYYAAAELELKRKNSASAEKLLLKSIEISDNNEQQKQMSYLMLGDVSYFSKKYINAASSYDSIQVGFLLDPDQLRVNNRRPPLDSISKNVLRIQKEDSLERIALMPVNERTLYLKNLLKKIRKENGLKEVDNEVSFGGNLPNLAAEDLFKPANSDFYFASGSLKTKGLSDFKAKWGTRPNVDNWRRQSAVDRSFNPTVDVMDAAAVAVTKKIEPKELTLETLEADLPLTNQQLEESNKKLFLALTNNAYIFQYYLQDYPTAIDTYNELLKRFPNNPPSETFLYNLNLCYNKTGQYQKGDSLIGQLKTQYPSGVYTKKIINAPSTVSLSPAEQTYAAIYRSFLEGQFEYAKEKKIQADQQFGKNYWTPQLLYIESIYYIKQKQDSIAINRLESIQSMFPKTDMGAKSSNMIDVLKRRKEIEAYLSNLNIERPEEVVSRNIDLNNTNTTKIDLPKTTITNPTPLQKIAPVVSAPVINKRIIPITDSSYQFNSNDAQYVVFVLNKVDPIFISEAKNAFNRFNQDKLYGQKIPITILPINDSIQFLLIGGPFGNASAAINYLDQTKPLTNSRIVPWLTADKYSYSLISLSNLAILQKNRNYSTYSTFLHQLFPDKF